MLRQTRWWPEAILDRLSRLPYAQEQLTGLSNLRELVVHAKRPLHNMEALLLRLPLLVISNSMH